MRLSIVKSVALAVVATVFASGCIVQTGPGPDPIGCSTNLSTLTVKDFANESVNVYISGATPLSFTMVPDQIRSETLVAGTYRVRAVGITTGLVLSDSTSVFSCDASFELTLTPAEPPVVVVDYAELDISNDTNENLLVYVDSVYENRLLPGEIGQYLMLGGTHSVQILQESTGTVLHESTDFYVVNTVTTWSVTSTNPEVEIHNNLFGVDSECVNTFVDTQAVQFDGGLYDVCPTEIGTFALYNGDHLLEIFGQSSAFQYVDLSQYFPENTTTVVNVQ